MYTFKPHVFIEHSSNNTTRPEERMKSHIQCDGENVYIFSGEHRESEFYDLWRHNLTSGKWKEMRTGVTHQDIKIRTFFEEGILAMYCIKDACYDSEYSKRFKLHTHILKTKCLTTHETIGQNLESLCVTNLIRHKKELYTIGVRSGRESSSVYKINIEDSKWEVVDSCRLDDNEPKPGIGRFITFGNNMIYVFDGTVLEPLAFNEIPAFDLEKRCWEKVYTYGDENHIPHYPTPRESFGITSYTDPDSGEINVIISGGRDVNNRCNDVWKLNLTSLKWTCLQRFGAVLPYFVVSNSIAVSPAGQLFTYGGEIFSRDIGQRRCIATLHSTWLRIPKLTDICWEAVSHYLPNLSSMSDGEINSLGLPVRTFRLRMET